jgi:Acyl-CoA carboxylase epsilon subunit
VSGDSVADDAATPEERRALFRVVRGAPSDAELAALTVVLAAAALSPEPAAATRAASAWAAPAARMRRPLQPGPDAWRTSTWAR